MRRAHDEDGFALVAAMILLAVIFGLGLALLFFSNAEQTDASHEQGSEAAFNIANSALNAQIGQLSRNWPQSEGEMPLQCESSKIQAGEANGCPGPTDLSLSPDAGSTTCPGTDAWGSSLSNEWTTYVRYDPGESPYFNSSAEETQPSFTLTPGAGALWVRAVGVVNCHAVAVVSLVTRLHVALRFNEDAIVGNWFEITTNGNKTVVNRQGNNAAEAAPISMRCEGKPVLKECENYFRDTQIEPPIGTENPTSSTITLTASQLATLRDEALAYKTFYSSTFPYKCPASTAELEGKELSATTRGPVYVEGCTLSFNKEKEGGANTEANPGFLVLADGTLEMNGNATYYGVVYARNLQESDEVVVSVHGGSRVVGGIIVDGKGGIAFGSSGPNAKGEGNFEYDPLATQSLAISAGAAATRNSFRILPAGQ